MIVKSTMPYIMVRVASSRKFGSFNQQVIIDCNSYDHIVQNAILSRLRASPDANSGSCSYTVNDNPFAVLGSLEGIGFKVVAANSIREVCGSNEVWQIWTLHKQA